MSMKCKKFFDKSFFFTTLVLVFSMSIYLFLSTNIKDFLFRPWIPDSDYPTMWDYVKYLYEYSSVLYSVQYILQFITPILAGISAIAFYTKKTNFFNFIASRKLSYKKMLLSEIFITSLKLAMASYLAFLVFYIAINFTQSPEIGLLNPDYSFSVGYSSAYLSDIFGDKFYFDHTRIFYLLDSFTRVFYPVFIYSLLGCSFALLIDKKYKAFLAVLFYYYGITLFLNRLPSIKIGEIDLLIFIRYLEPARITAPHSLYIPPEWNTTGMKHPSTILLFLCSLLPICIISFFCIRKAVVKDQERIV